ncbi:DUF4062 domain-containing protein [Granulicella aggregans]|jgi:hypothetical protein|uniref:DUF4062 domain-containing protein n=1 Tax=Granulicella aggregans TaxID=474949 RepID=UPI0021E05EF5|nr:DUF4062 domain-containing protein [Granulicella aggregans]
MPSKIRVFLSSKQTEFTTERLVMAHMIRDIPVLEPVLAEEWFPSGSSIKQVYLNDVRTCPIYVGLFGAIYSEPTHLEYLAACENPYREKLIYLKNSDNIDEPLLKLIEDFKSRLVFARFSTIADLLPVFSNHLIAALTRMMTTLQLLGEVKPVTQGAGLVMEKRWANRQKQIQELELPNAAELEDAIGLLRERGQS